MTMSTRQLLRSLTSLYRILEAGERGYAMAAANVNNRGLKLLFKSFAQQRASFKCEIFGEMQHLDEHARPPSGSFLAMVHRGRIDIFAALTIGNENVEKVILKEVVFGEHVALGAYQRTLKKELSPRIMDMVTRQFNEIRQVVDQVNLMRGKDRKRLLVRLFDTNTDVNRAVQNLHEAGFAPESIEMVPVDKAAILYKGRDRTMLETVLSGAVGGAFWGALFGALAAFGVLQIPIRDPLADLVMSQQLWAFIALMLCLVGGTFVGTMIGTFIGWGTRGGDVYLYGQGLERGRVLLKLLTDESRASKAWHLLAQVNIESKAHGKEVMA